MEAFVGQITIFAGNYAPVGWAFCHGQLLPITEFDALFSLLATTYGGDGVTNFALPDLRGRVPVGMGANPMTGTTYGLSQQGGVEEVTLTTAQLPTHTHPMNVDKSSGGEGAPASAYPGVASADGSFLAYVPQPTDPSMLKAMSPQAVSAVGASQPHNNVMPSQPLNFIIATTGVYPTRN